MSRVRAFGRFWWDFVVGDDWRLALGGAIALALTGVAAHEGLDAWWLAPAAVLALLGATLVGARPRPPR